MKMRPNLGFILAPLLLLHLPSLLLGQELKTETTTASPDLDPDKGKNFSVTDPSCKSDLDNIYKYEPNNATLNTATLFDRNGRLPSYIGYPCNVELYEKYRKDFIVPFLECPFQPGLDKKFRDFVRKDLWEKRQLDLDKATWLNNSLMYQLICFSQQFEECVLDGERSKPIQVSREKSLNGTVVTYDPPMMVQGACTGVCECMDRIPIKESQLPKDTKEPLKWPDNAPDQTLDLEVKCGVKVGGVCIHKWTEECKKLSSPDLERKYQPKDFYLPCQRLAGCQKVKKICECASGHTCGGRRSGVGDRSWITWIMLGMAFLVKNILR